MSALLAFFLMTVGHVPGWRAARRGGSRPRALEIGAVCWAAGLVSLTIEYGAMTAVVLGLLLWSIGAAVVTGAGGRT